MCSQARSSCACCHSAFIGKVSFLKPPRAGGCLRRRRYRSRNGCRGRGADERRDRDRQADQASRTTCAVRPIPPLPPWANQTRPRLSSPRHWTPSTSSPPTTSRRGEEHLLDEVDGQPPQEMEQPGDVVRQSQVLGAALVVWLAKIPPGACRAGLPRPAAGGGPGRGAGRHALDGRADVRHSGTQGADLPAGSGPGRTAGPCRSRSPRQACRSPARRPRGTGSSSPASWASTARQRPAIADAVQAFARSAGEIPGSRWPADPAGPAGGAR